MMKPFLGIDQTVDKQNEIYNGEEFLTVKTPELQLELVSRAAEENETVVKKAGMPLPMKIAVGIFAAVAAILSLLTEVFEEGETNSFVDSNPWVIPVFFGAVAIVIVCFIYAHFHNKKTLATDEAKHVQNNLAAATEALFAYNGVPGDATTVDVLSFTYKVKNGEPVPTTAFLSATPLYVNMEMRAYRKSDALCLADEEGIYELPLDGICRIRTVNKRIAMLFWNKSTPFNKPPYKEFSVRETEEHNYTVKPYYILEIEHNGETYGVYFPAYELSLFQRLTGLTPEPPETAKTAKTPER